MPPEEIFSRLAGRVLVLNCDLSADDSTRASGVLISADGFVATNAHVVEGCRSMNATQIGGTSRRSYQAVLKYYDKKGDTAVLKIDGKGFDSFGLPTRIARVGERVYAIGNPRGLEQSISEGIVSGLREEDGTLWIQHSAPVSPGSSGGALISSRGELLGINSIPDAFPSDKVESAMDYEFVRFGDRQFLVPVHGETLSCQRDTSTCSRNAIDFRNYYEYSGEATTGPSPGQNPPYPQ
jgi:S1-C subfamily serine protease